MCICYIFAISLGIAVVGATIIGIIASKISDAIEYKNRDRHNILH